VLLNEDINTDSDANVASETFSGSALFKFIVDLNLKAAALYERHALLAGMFPIAIPDLTDILDSIATQACIIILLRGRSAHHSVHGYLEVAWTSA